MTNPNEIWQVEVNNQIFEANVEELCQWITEGALLPADKVRRGNLRWLEARKVPILHQFFNAKEAGLPFPVLQTITDASAEIDAPPETENPPAAQTANASLFCANHAEEAAKYICENCSNLFCKACPTAYGASVRICPSCGALCKLIADVQTKQQRNVQYQTAVREGFGLADFGRAFAYPFKFKTSLIFGALMFMFFSLGQSAAAMGGMILYAAAIFSAMLANALTFGCLANTIDNFSQGKTDADFMPGFDDFELWNDVIHPFFLSIGTYLVSFAPLIVVIVASMFYLASSLKTPVSPIENAPAQIEQKNGIIDEMNKRADERNRQIGEEMNGNFTGNPNAGDEAARLEKMIQENRRAELESTIGKTPETVQKENEQLVKQFLGKGAFVLIFALLALLWGIVYFPAACAVAGYTRSFVAVLNPLVGLDTIKRLGFNYAKILAMFFTLACFSFGITVLLETVLAPFDMPRLGNMPAKAVGSLFTFYFSIVFSVALGFALYKSSDRLNLYRG